MSACTACGLRLAPAMGGAAPNMPYQPAAMPPARTGGPLGDEGMPAWLRQLQDGGAMRPQVPQAQWPAGGGGQQGQQGQQQGQLAASSLMNPDALPDWLRGGPAGGAPMPQQSPAPYAAPAADPWAANQQGGAWGPAPAAQSPYPGQSPYAPPSYGAPQPSPLAARDGRQPPAPSGGGASLAAGVLFDEASLPDWLRQSAGEQGIEAQPTLQQPSPFQPPAQGNLGGRMPGRMPLPNAGSYASPQGAPPFQGASPNSAFLAIERVRAPGQMPVESGLAGGALVDPRALPTWLGGQGAASPPDGQDGRAGSSGMAAQTLIDETALPEWLRAQSSSVAPAPAPPQVVPSAPPGGAVWTNRAADRGGGVWPEMAGQPAAPPTPVGPAMWPAQGFGAPPRADFVPSAGPGSLTAGSFVDEGALPEWLRVQNGTEPGGWGSATGRAPEAQPEARVAPRYASGAGGAGGPSGMVPILDSPAPSPVQFAASDLIDPEALPEWTRGRVETPQASFSSSAGWSVQPEGPSQIVAAAPSTSMQPRPDVRRHAAARGPRPIPAGELPPWLQGTGVSGPSARGGREGYAEPGGDGGWDDADDQNMYTDEYTNERAAAYGEAYGERYDNGYGAGERAGGYDEEYDDASAYGSAYGDQMAGGYQGEYTGAYDETGYNGQGYDESGSGGGGYDNYGTGVPDGWGPQEQDDQRGGWRRLFGRR